MHYCFKKGGTDTIYFHYLVAERSGVTRLTFELSLSPERAMREMHKQMAFSRVPVDGLVKEVLSSDGNDVPGAQNHFRSQLLEPHAT